MRGNDHWDLRGQAQAVGQESVGASVLTVTFQCGEGRDGGAQHVHRVAVFGGADDVIDLVWQLSGCLESGVKSRQFCFGRQLTVDQQIADFLKGGLRGEVVNGIATIRQLAFGAIDVGDARTLEINALEAAVDLDVFGHGWLLLRIRRYT